MNKKLWSSSGVILILIACFLPLFYFNDQIISIIPLFNNFEISETTWSWRDIAAFALSIPILSVTLLYLINKSLRYPVLIIANLILILFLFILAAVWMATTKNLNSSISFGAGPIIFIIGYILTVVFGRSLHLSSH